MICYSFFSRIEELKVVQFFRPTVKHELTCQLHAIGEFVSMRSTSEKSNPLLENLEQYVVFELVRGVVGEFYWILNYPSTT